MKLRKAKESEIAKIAALYESVKGQKGCTWDEFYPNIDTAREDFSCGGLYVLEDDENIIGAVSVVGENELDDKDCWRVKENAREIARIAIEPSHQGNGLAAELLMILFRELKDSGCRAVHLLVAKENPPALHTYKKLGFAFLGDCFMYDHDYFMCEKIL